MGGNSDNSLQSKGASFGFLKDDTTANFTSLTVARTEIVMDHSARDIWVALMDTSYEGVKSWKPAVVSVEHISGDQGEEGELTLSTKDPKRGQAPFYLKIIRVVPEKQRVLYISAVDHSFSVSVDHSLYEAGNGKTKVVYNGYIATPGANPDQFDAKQAEKGLIAYLDKSLELLEKEVGRRTSQ